MLTLLSRGGIKGGDLLKREVGNCRDTVVPCPGTLRISIVPRCRSMMVLTREGRVRNHVAP